MIFLEVASSTEVRPTACQGTERVNPTGAEQGWALVGAAVISEESDSLLVWDRWHFLEKQIQMSSSIIYSRALIFVDI